jgi:hypothetical protein
MATIIPWQQTNLDWRPGSWRVFDEVDGVRALLSVWPVRGDESWWHASLTLHSSQKHIGQFQTRVAAMCAAERALGEAQDSAESGMA